MTDHADAVTRIEAGIEAAIAEYQKDDPSVTHDETWSILAESLFDGMWDEHYTHDERVAFATKHRVAGYGDG